MLSSQYSSIGKYTKPIESTLDVFLSCRCDYFSTVVILGIKYVIPPESRTWEDARKACLTMKGDLLSVLSNDEHDDVANELHRLGVGTAWIGLSDRNNEGDYRWSDKFMFNYSNWGAGEPNGGSDENCIHMMSSSKNHKWNDISCNTVMRYVCKILR